MPLKGCLFCRRKIKLFEINTIYGNTEHPIKHYIMEFLGNCDPYLKDESGICSKCVYVLNALLYMKKYMCFILKTHAYVFSKAYKEIKEKLQVVNYETEDETSELDSEVDENSDNSNDSNESDRNLLKPLRSSPWVEVEEAEFNRSCSGTTWTDGEIQSVLGRRKRRRGHRWTRHKRSQSRGPAESIVREPIYRRNRPKLSSNYSEGNRLDSSDEDDRTGSTKRKHLSDPSIRRMTKYSCIQGCTDKYAFKRLDNC